MPLILGANSASGGYTVKNSLRFNSGSSDYLNRTPSSTTNRQTWTWSAWVKRANLSSAIQELFASGLVSAAYNFTRIFFDASDRLIFQHYPDTNSGYLTTTQVFRDASAWYHIVVVFNSTSSTSSDRMKIYVNGSQVTDFTTGVFGTTYPAQNTNSFVNDSTYNHTIGRSVTGYSTYYYNGYMSEIYLIDGQALTPSSFGQTDPSTPSSGIWVPKAYTGSYGTNGFYLKFANSASLGTDSSGNGNNFTVNNLTSVDQTTDTPTNNFATLNPLDTSGGKIGTMTEGNLQAANPNNADDFLGRSTMAVDKGKWYWEVKCISRSGSFDNYTVGIDNFNSPITSGGAIGTTAGSYAYYANGGTKVNNNSYVSYGASFTAGDIIGVALDLDNGFIYFSKNGTFQNSGVPTSGATGTGNAFSSLSGLFTPAISDTGSVTAMTMGTNFGSPYYSANSYTDGAGYGNFSYAVPSGYYALCSANLAKYG
jgi:Concanavalin A-like lectin/glucanases superfamily/SPRY domain